MTVYLVDFENVRSEGLKGVEELTSEDKVVIFYSKNADAITFDVHTLLSKSSAEIETYRILRGGHNSLDFQLSTYLGYLVMENSFKEIVIISRDKGFLCVTNFWEENRDKCNCDIKLCRSIGAAFDNIELDNDFEDGLAGRFIERLSGKDGVILSVNGEEVAKELPDESADGEDSEKQVSEERMTEDTTSGKERTETRVYGRPPGPKRTTYSTNIFTKAEPYYRVPNQEGARNRKPWQNDERKSNEPWRQAAGDKKPWKPGKPGTRKQHSGQKKESDSIKRDVEEELPVNRLINKAMEKLINSPADRIPASSTDVSVTKPLPPNPQNPISKNKVFAAEVKLNINDDVRELIKDKYDDSYVPVLVEAIGMSTGKQHFYKMMVNKVGQEKGLDLYRMIKSHYTNLKRK
ncbi:MAG: hypothetical protein HFI34_09920 [Lachnospiraceae bacterium]|nr:hypothetical protein [Lachnospiraceae bacterium]